jgi:small subunit ribosomal protein S20
VANNKSAKKRIEINERDRLRNKAYKSTIRTIYKKCMLAIHSLTAENKTDINILMSLAYSKIDSVIRSDDSVILLIT